MQFRDACPADAPQIVALNLASEHFLSPLNRTRFDQIRAQAAYCRVLETDGVVRAFLLAFREGSQYDSSNYRWFASRFGRFLYIDRIVVANAARSRGIGTAFYGDLLEFAKQSGTMRVTCEFDTYPPNLASQKFHAAFGFAEVGVRQLATAGKTVSLQVLMLGAANTC